VIYPPPEDRAEIGEDSKSDLTKMLNNLSAQLFYLPTLAYFAVECFVLQTCKYLCVIVSTSYAV